jgi:hypothetical protein
VKLTSLRVDYGTMSCDTTAEQLQHLSSLTALQQLSVKSFYMKPGDLSGIKQLPQLTSLKITDLLCTFESSDTHSWASMTALQSLTLRHCRVDLRALRGLTQLQALSLVGIKGDFRAKIGRIISAVTQFPQLTELYFSTGETRRSWFVDLDEPAFGVNAFTACTASSNLHKLKLLASRFDFKDSADCVLFKPGVAFPWNVLWPHLRVIDLCYEASTEPMRLGKQQLQHVCSCCPALESLAFVLGQDFSRDSSPALRPLLQLSSLTHLVVHNVGVAAAAVVGVTAQLTRLKQLQLRGLPQLSRPALLQLTALTGLQELKLHDRATPPVALELQNKVGVDVYTQC